MLRYFFLAGVILLVINKMPVNAQTITHPDSALRKILNEHKGTHISLDETIQHALNNATVLKISEASYAASLGSLRRESGIFDPEFFLNVNYLDQDAPAASFFAGADVLKTKQTNYQSGLRLALPYGTELELSVNAVRLNTNSRFASLNPEYNTFGNLRFRQSLLGGFSVTSRENLNRTEREVDAEKFRYQQQKLSVQAETERLYWDLYAAERNYAVQQLIKNQADSLMRETELRAQAGLVGPNQVANARTFLAEQELLLLEREEQLDTQSDRLISYIGYKPVSSDMRFIPSDDPPTEFAVEDVDILLEAARKNNLELKAVEQDIQAFVVQRDAAKWRSLPSINLVGSLIGSGLSGTSRDIIFGTDTLRSAINGGLNDAFSQLSHRDYPGWNIGLEVNVPIGFRTGLGEKERLEAQVLRSQQVSNEISRNIEDQLRFAWRELFHSKRRMEAAIKGVQAAQEQVRIGMVEFHNGRATAFELVRLGSDLATAQQRYTEALVRTAKASTIINQLTSGNSGE